MYDNIYEKRREEIRIIGGPECVIGKLEEMFPDIKGYIYYDEKEKNLCSRDESKFFFRYDGFHRVASVSWVGFNKVERNLSKEEFYKKVEEVFKEDETCMFITPIIEKLVNRFAAGILCQMISSEWYLINELKLEHDNKEFYERFMKTKAATFWHESFY